MAFFQTMTGTNLPLKLTLFTGNTLHTKIIPAQAPEQELVPFTVTVAPANAMVLVKNDVRTKANFQILTLRVDKPGLALLSAVNAKGQKATPIHITIAQPISLPPANTDAGALTRLMLAEAPTPFTANYSTATAKTGMHWMRLVVQNRFNAKSAEVGSAGAQSLTDVIKSVQPSEQFKGFSQYPKIAQDQANVIQKILDIANDGTHPKQALFFDHLAAAIAVPKEALLADPCPTRLLGWRTAGAAGPGGKFKLFKTFAGQDFYTI